MPVDDLREEAVDVFGETRVTEAAALADAIDLAVQLAEAEGELGGGVLVTGSLALVGEARRLLRH
jgi:dihydrofolate synthase/folylpolyglutamate synthase